MITKALMFSCDNENGNRIERTYGCTFIFTDEIDKGLNKGYTLQSKNVDALFYENENVKKHFDTVRELYDYCNKFIVSSIYAMYFT